MNHVLSLKARSDELGHKAVEDLAKEGLKVSYHQLDIDNVESIQKCTEYIKSKHGGLDLLVNNAAIAYKVFFLVTKKKLYFRTFKEIYVNLDERRNTL